MSPLSTEYSTQYIHIFLSYIVACIYVLHTSPGTSFYLLALFCLSVDKCTIPLSAVLCCTHDLSNVVQKPILMKMVYQVLLENILLSI